MKFKVLVVSVFFVCSLLSGICIAQNKVVVIPLMSECGNVIPTVTSAGGRVWMDRNLGAERVAQSVDDYHAYGYLFQWGRLADGHEIRSPITTTLSGGNVPGHGNFITPAASPYNWRSSFNNDLWQPGTGINNPCPPGFRVPTETEWEIERASWSSNDSAGAFASPLKLVVAGYRDRSDGTVYSAGSYGAYWSSAVSGSSARSLGFASGYAYMYSYYRAYGFSVRCLKE